MNAIAAQAHPQAAADRADDPAVTLDMWAPKQEPELAADEFARWKLAVAAVAAIGRRDKLNKSTVARRADVPIGTFSPWFDGTYTGKVTAVTARIEKWLEAMQERVGIAGDVAVPAFVQTPTASEVWHALVVAQTLPGITLITLGPGMGKTVTGKHYADTRPHAVRITMRPTTSRIFGMLTDLSLALGVVEYSPARLDRAIGEQLKRNGRHTLLIVDEAQNLDDNAVNQLRHYHDIYGCGIALLGNAELYGRFGGAEPKKQYAQLHRRFGQRICRLTPREADIDVFVAAWNIADAEINKLLRAIGHKPGALGQITETMKMAGILAAGDACPINADHVRKAWTNRGGESLRNGIAREDGRERPYGGA
jgi:DNA transposition AAA+ family ATPase